ncbi:MAG: alpha-L-arabinofuranosidase C-terminal domain-containing protein [Planctomycetota bacterium]
MSLITPSTPAAAGAVALAPAAVTIDAAHPLPEPLSRYLTGKFCEHLGANIYGGMSAQVLANPTFARHEFAAHDGDHPDGGARYECSDEKIRSAIEQQARHDHRPDAAALFAAWKHGLAYPWIAEGSLTPVPGVAISRPAEAAAREVRVSPDVSPHGRAQRVEARAGYRGIAQYTYLPLHRCRAFECRVAARSAGGATLRVALFGGEAATAAVTSDPIAIGAAFAEQTVRFTVPENLPADGLYRLAVLFEHPGDAVLARVELFPQDPRDESDPDVIDLLKASKLPLLRWPGGNFVSGYRWRDGIGPKDTRPGRVNPAWAGVESNLYGLHEFIAFCKHVGCEPMLCVNAGDGTPEEAADWVEYCNGSARTPLGKLRKKNGHAKPFGIRLWEIGNELTGEHQISWTSPAGYADRYSRFAAAMLARDPNAVLLGCGAPVDWFEDWNERLFKAYPDRMPWITDHILRGGGAPASTDPRDLYQAFMALPVWYEAQYRAQEAKMRAAGNPAPRLAITELQLFAQLQERDTGGAPARLTHQTHVTPDTLAEAVYDLLFYHMAVRLAPFVGLITHSATVNHGGGLRKVRERVFANPCHHAQQMFAEFNGATPLPVEVAAPTFTAVALVHPGVHGRTVPVVDAVAVRGKNGTVTISLVQRGVAPQPVELILTGLPEAGSAALTQLAAAEPWARNTLAKPDAVVPVDSKLKYADGRLKLVLPPCSVTRVRIKS